MHPITKLHVHPSADCVVGCTTYQRADQGRWGDGDSGDCDPYWPAEKGQVATTQSADGCTIELRSLNSISVPNLVSVAKKFPKTEGPLPNKLFRSWRVQPASHRNANQQCTQAGFVHV